MEATTSGIFNRTELLVGSEVMDKYLDTKVIIFGVGGVGSWCAEGLCRSGIGHITIVDSDAVSITNVNRQLMATTRTVGQSKVSALKNRLMEINPEAEITAMEMVWTEETRDCFDLGSYDYIIDCVDSLRHKVSLIMEGCRVHGKLFSSMGAALKIDPTRIKTARFSKVKGCPLGASIRRYLRRRDMWPSRDFICVYDDEVLSNRGVQPEEEDTHANSSKAVINGTTAPVTGIFGLTLAGLVLNDIYRKTL